MKWPKGCDVDAINRDCISITSVYPYLPENNSDLDNHQILSELENLIK